MRALVVDKSAVVRERLTELLSSLAGRDLCCECVPPEQMEAALSVFRPDVVLLGVSSRETEMPEHVAHVRDVLPHAQIIILSDGPDSPLRALCLAAGADAYLDKALEFFRLADILPTSVPTSVPPRPAA